MAVTAPTGMTASLGGAWAGRSPRERKLLVGLGIIVLIAAPIWTFGKAAEARSANVEARAELDQLQAQVQRSSGGAAARMDAAHAEVLQWAWEAPTASVGQVLAQRQAAQLATSAGLSGVEVRASDRHEVAGEVTLAPIEIIATFNWNGFSRLMSSLGGEGRGFIIDSVQLTEEDQPKLRIGIRVPVVTSRTQAAA